MRRSLTTKFVISSLLAFIVIGLVTGYAIVGEVKNQVFLSLMRNAEMAQKQLVTHHLGEEDFLDKSNSSRLTSEVFDEFIHDTVISEEIIKLKIYRRDGKILYSTDKTEVGDVHIPDQKMTAALEGKEVFGQTPTTADVPETIEMPGEKGFLRPMVPLSSMEKPSVL